MSLWLDRCTWITRYLNARPGGLALTLGSPRYGDIRDDGAEGRGTAVAKARLTVVVPACRVARAAREEAPLRNSSRSSALGGGLSPREIYLPQGIIFLPPHAVAALRTRSETHTLT